MNYLKLGIRGEVQKPMMCQILNPVFIIFYVIRGNQYMALEWVNRSRIERWTEEKIWKKRESERWTISILPFCKSQCEKPTCLHIKNKPQKVTECKVPGRSFISKNIICSLVIFPCSQFMHFCVSQNQTVICHLLQDQPGVIMFMKYSWNLDEHLLELFKKEKVTE